MLRHCLSDATLQATRLAGPSACGGSYWRCLLQTAVSRSRRPLSNDTDVVSSGCVVCSAVSTTKAFRKLRVLFECDVCFRERSQNISRLLQERPQLRLPDITPTFRKRLIKARGGELQ